MSRHISHFWLLVSIITSFFCLAVSIPSIAATCTQESVVFDSGYRGGCGYTQTTSFNLPKDETITRIRIWYNISRGGDTPSATLMGPSGYQKSIQSLTIGNNYAGWAEALWPLNEVLKAGAYTLTFSSNSVCSDPSGASTLILYGCEAPVVSDQPFNVSASASGTNASLTLNLDLDVAASDIGSQGSIFLGASVPNVGWFLNDGNVWRYWSSGPLPAYYTGALPGTKTIPVLTYANVVGLEGTEVYAGYGRTVDDMLSRGMVKLGYILGQVSTTVYPSSAQALNYQGQLTVSVPGGLLDEVAELRIASLTGPPASVFPGLEALGLYSVSLGNTNSFDAPIKLEFTYDQNRYNSALKNGGLIAAGWNSDLGWFTPPQRIDEARKVLQVETQHLSKWGLFTLAGFSSETSPQGHADVYYQPGGITPRFPEFPASYTMQELAEDVGNWADQALANYSNAGFKSPSLPLTVILAGNIQETEWNPTSGYIYLKTAKTTTLEALRHDLAHEIFHAVQNSYYSVLTMTQWWSEATPDYAASRIGYPTTSLHADIGLDFFETPLATARAPGEADALHAYSFAHFWNFLVTRHGGNFKTGWDYVFNNSLYPSDASRFNALSNYVAGLGGSSITGLWSDFVDFSLLRNDGEPGWGYLLNNRNYARELSENTPSITLSYNLEKGYTARAYVLSANPESGQSRVDVHLTAMVPAANQRVEVFRSVDRGEPSFIEILSSSHLETTVNLGANERLVLVGKNMSTSTADMQVVAQMTVSEETSIFANLTHASIIFNFNGTTNNAYTGNLAAGNSSAHAAIGSVTGNTFSGQINATTCIGCSYNGNISISIAPEATSFGNFVLTSDDNSSGTFIATEIRGSSLPVTAVNRWSRSDPNSYITDITGSVQGIEACNYIQKFTMTNINSYKCNSSSSLTIRLADRPL